MKKMRRFLAIALTLAMVLSLAACGGSKKEETTTTEGGDAQESTADSTGITLWTYPIGGWGDENAVKELTDAFEAETGIKVTVEYLAYAVSMPSSLISSKIIRIRKPRNNKNTT